MSAKEFSLNGYMKLSGKNKLQKFQPDSFGAQIISSQVEGFFGFDNKNMTQVEFNESKDGIKVKELVSGDILNVIKNMTCFPKFGGVCVLITVQKHPDYKKNFIPITRFAIDTLLKNEKYDKDKTFFILMERDDSKNGVDHHYSFSSDPVFRATIEKYMRDKGIHKTKEYKKVMKMNEVKCLNGLSIL